MYTCTFTKNDTEQKENKNMKGCYKNYKVFLKKKIDDFNRMSLNSSHHSKTKLNITSIKTWGESVEVSVVQQYLAIIENDGTYESPSAASQLTSVHKVLELTDLYCALKPAHTNHHIIHHTLYFILVTKHLTSTC